MSSNTSSICEIGNRRLILHRYAPLPCVIECVGRAAVTSSNRCFQHRSLALGFRKQITAASVSREVQYSSCK